MIRNARAKEWFFRLVVASVGSLLGTSLSTGMPKADSGPTLKFQDWLQDLSVQLPKSSVLTALMDEVDAAGDAAKAAYLQAPFTLTSGLAESRYRLVNSFIPTATGTLDWDNSLTYLDRSSLTTSVQLSAGVSSYSPIPILDGNGNPTGNVFNVPTNSDYSYAINFKVSYDLIRGGADGLGWLNAKSERFNAERRRFTADSQLIDQKIQFIKSAADLYVSQCKIRTLQSAQQSINYLLKAGKEQLRAKTLAYKDYLNFTGLESQFATRILSERLKMQLGMQSLATYGLEFIALSQPLNGATLGCTGELDRPVPAIADAEVDRLARVMPNFMAADAETRSADYAAKSAHLQNKPSLSPFVSAGYSQEDYANTNPSTYLPSVSAGVMLQWNIPGPKGSTAEESARISAAAASQRARQVFSQNSSRLGVLLIQINSEREILETLRTTQKNAEELVHVLEAHRAIGSVDSLNYTTAFIGSIDAKNSTLDSWGSLTKSIYELEEYRTWAKRAQSPDSREPASRY